MREHLIPLLKPIACAIKAIYGEAKMAKEKSRKSEPNTLADSGNEKSAVVEIKVEHGSKIIVATLNYNIYYGGKVIILQDMVCPIWGIPYLFLKQSLKVLPRRGKLPKCQRQA